MVVAGCAAPFAPMPAYAVTTAPTDCPLRVPDELEEGQTIRCGYLRVPQDRDDPASPIVELPYAHIRAESVQPAPDPVIFVAGGPGGSALAEFDQVYAWLRPLRRERDLIVYDQRGTLLARPVLACDAVATVDAAALAAADRDLPAYLRPSDANDVAVVACAHALQAQGVDLAAYDTPTHAQDLVDLGRALGYARANLVGVSYGTRIILETLRQSPGFVRAAVLDSLLPPEVAAYEAQGITSPVAVLRTALDDCAADAACAAVYPEIAARFDALPARLAAAPPSLPAPWALRFDAAAWWEFLLTRMTPATLPYLPRLVTELEAGDVTTLRDLLDGSLPPPGPQVIGVGSAPAPSPAVLAFVRRLNEAYFLSAARQDPAVQAAWRLMAARHAERPRIERFIAQELAAYIPAAEQSALLAELAALSDTELDVACRELAGAPSHSITPVANLAVECRDEQPFNQYAAATLAHRDLGIPDAVAASTVARLRHFWVQCALWPAPPAAQTQSEPVSAAQPVLILQGAWDAVTPAAWAGAAADHLTHAQVVRFPATGHGVLAQSIGAAAACPAQIMRQFLTAPDHAVDAACVAETYAAAWAMPAQD